MTTKSTTDRTLLLERRGNPDLKITIPEDWKITFGPVNPGKAGYGEENALRLYETKDKQRAVFTNVISFRDLSIPIEEKVVASKSKTKAQSDGRGNSSSSQERETEESWEAVK